MLDHIREHVITNYGTGDWNQYVNAQLVRRLFAFEILVAPYTIAHLKLSLFLKSQGWNTQERLRIYLTNTLEEAVEKERYIFAEYISDETNAAVSVKRDLPILVILGNPPYPLQSANPSVDKKGSQISLEASSKIINLWMDNRSGKKIRRNHFNLIMSSLSDGHSGELIKTGRALSDTL